MFKGRSKWVCRIQVAGVLFGVSCLAFVSGSGYQSGNDKPEQWVTIHAETEWYRARSEPEKLWRGVLLKRDTPPGPNSRTALKYSLRTGKDDKDNLAVYAAGAEERLTTFLDREVLVRGKLVDLSAEGQGKELWIASIRNQSPCR